MNQPANNYPYYPQPTVCPNDGQAYVQVPVGTIQAATSEFSNMMMENRCLRSQHEIDMNRLRSVNEEAYSVVKDVSHHLWVADKRGNQHCLLDTSFDSVAHIQFDPIFNKEPCFVIKIYNNPIPAVIEDKDFNRPERLVAILAQACSKSFRLYVSSRKTGVLLQQYICSVAVEQLVPFYFGWHYSESTWHFELVNASTHSNLLNASPRSSDYHRQKSLDSPVSMLIATEQMIVLLEIVADPGVRCTLCLWMHAAVMYSLLDGLGYQIPIGLNLYAPDARVRRYLESLLCWFNDPAVKLSQQPRAFMQSLVSRKDQPLVIRGGTSQNENQKVFLNIVESGEIPLKVSKEISSLRLQSLPTVITECASILSVSYHLATIDLEGSCISAYTGERLDALKRYIPDYLNAFTDYTTKHIDDLCDCVAQGIDTVTYNDRGYLNEDSIATLGIMQGIQRFLSQFFREIVTGDEMAQRMRVFVEPDNLRLFEGALEHAASGGCDSEDIVSSFLHVVNKMIDENQFDTCSTHCVASESISGDSDRGVLYYDDTYYSFTGKAFRRICSQCGTTRPALLRALQDKALLKGARVNGETSTTRITVQDNAGNSRQIPVYKFLKETFEMVI